MDILEINLIKYRGDRSSLFTGRTQGEDARKDLALNQFDEDIEKQVIFIIPEGTTSFNPSFYLGLLYDSYKKLGIDNFSKKYSFRIESDDSSTIKVVQDNLNDGERNALNELNNKTGLWRFIK